MMVMSLMHEKQEEEEGKKEYVEGERGRTHLHKKNTEG